MGLSFKPEVIITEHLNFIQISELIEKTLAKAESAEINSVEDVLAIDKLARIETNNLLNKLF